MSEDYSIERTKKYMLKLREVLKELPPVFGEFFRGIEQTTSALTRYGYALDLRLFFKFLIGTELGENTESIRKIDAKFLDSVTADHIERFLEYISLYPDENGGDEDQGAGFRMPDPETAVPHREHDEKSDERPGRHREQKREDREDEDADLDLVCRAEKQDRDRNEQEGRGVV